MGKAASAATGVKQQTRNTISTSIVKTHNRINAIKSGTADGSLDAYYQVMDDLLKQLAELHAQAFNHLNDSQSTLNAIEALKPKSKKAKSKADRLKEITESINKFNSVLNKVTEIVGKLASL